MSPLRTFQGCWNRINRAEGHRKAFAKFWGELLEDDIYSSVLDMKDDGTGQLLILPRYNPLPDIFSLELGETLYQLRAALDASIYATAIQQSRQDPPPDEEHLEFPICRSALEFKNAARKVRPLSEKHLGIIESVQPYNAPSIPPQSLTYNINRTLSILNDWARCDRHRNLRLVGSWASRANPTIRLPSGCCLASIDVASDGFLEDEHVVATFKINGFRPGMKVEANPNLAIDIMVNEAPDLCSSNDTLGQRIESMITSVRWIVSALERSFEEVR
jgi:hypothetical protein